MVTLALLLLQSSLHRAESAMRNHDVAAAKAAVAEALHDDANSVPALTLRGRIAMAESDFDTARSVLTKAASLAPDKAGVQFLLGFFHYVDNDFVRARPVLERARQLAPRDPQAALFLAMTYEGLALPDLARGMFDEALKLRPSASAHLAYARMLFNQGQYDQAQTHVSAALQNEPNSRDAHYEQARLHFARSEFQQCIKEALQSIDLKGEDTSDRSIHFLLSRAYTRVGNPEQAAAHRRQFEAIPPRLIR